MKTHQKLIIGATLLSAFLIGRVAHADTTQDMYRLYNPNSGEHFYTANVNEKSNLIRYGWKDEGIGWTAPTSGDAVYRLYNPNSGDHHYTLSAKEKDNLARIGWKKEGIGWYSDVNKSIPLYRLYNPYAKTATHHYTSNVAESRMLTLIGWKDEGIGWYGVNKNNNNNNNSGNTNTGGSGNNSNNNGNNENNSGNRNNSDNNNTPKEPNVPTDKSEFVTTIYGTKINLTKVKEIAFELVNKERAKNNLSKFGKTADTTKLADIRANELVIKFSHDRPNGQHVSTIFKEYASKNKFYGEDCTEVEITKTSTEETLAKQLFDNFKNSKAHYDIMMLPRSKYLGIGISLEPNYKAMIYVEFLFSR